MKWGGDQQLDRGGSQDFHDWGGTGLHGGNEGPMGWGGPHLKTLLHNNYFTRNTSLALFHYNYFSPSQNSNYALISSNTPGPNHPPTHPHPYAIRSSRAHQLYFTTSLPVHHQLYFTRITLQKLLQQDSFTRNTSIDILQQNYFTIITSLEPLHMHYFTRIISLKLLD